jgi:DNA modification methylase
MPVDLAAKCIAAGSRPRDTILDPFMGTGTTGVAALDLGREFVGIDIDPQAVEVAWERLGAAKGARKGATMHQTAP